MKRKREEHNGCGGGHQVARRPEEQHPWMRILYASGGVVRWLKLFQTAGNVE